MSTSFLRKSSTVDAHQYDGSAQGAAALAKALHGLVAVSIDKPTSLVVVSEGRLKPVPAGSWIVTLWRCGGVEVWPDEAFHRDHVSMALPPVILLPAPEIPA